MKTCSQCGTVCPDSAVFCSHCGSSLSVPSQPFQPAPAATPVAPEPPAVDRSVATEEPPAAAPSVVPPSQPANAYPQTPPAPYIPPYVPPQAPPAPPTYGEPVSYTPPSPYGQPYGQPGQPAPYPGRKRPAPLVLGIIGIIFAILFPLVTYCCSIPGLVMANKDVQQGLPNQNARVLNIVALSIAALNSVLGMMLRFI